MYTIIYFGTSTGIRACGEIEPCGRKLYLNFLWMFFQHEGLFLRRTLFQSFLSLNIHHHILKIGRARMIKVISRHWNPSIIDKKIRRKITLDKSILCEIFWVKESFRTFFNLHLFFLQKPLLITEGGNDVLPYSEYFKSTGSTGVHESTTNRI